MAAQEPAAKRARPAALEAHFSTLALPSLGVICALAVGADGMVFVATCSALFVLSPSGTLALFSGSRTKTGYTDGESKDARFNTPRGLAVASDGSLLVADTNNHRLRRVSLYGAVSTIAGSQQGFPDGGFADGRPPRCPTDG